MVVNIGNCFCGDIEKGTALVKSKRDLSSQFVEDRTGI